MINFRGVTQRYRYSVILLQQLVKTDFKLRYQGSVLGYAWSLLKPLMMFLILYLVFTVFLPVGKGVPHYSVYLLLGIVLWNYFNEATTGSVDAIVGKGELLRQINFPKYVVVFSGSLSALINLTLNGVVIAIFMVFNHVGLTLRAVLLIPLIGELFVAAIAVAFLLSALYVRFRDIKHIWDVIMQAAFYATPILYPLSHIPHKAAVFLILNPVAQIIQDARYVLVTHTQPTISDIYHTGLMRLVPITLVVVVGILAGLYFRSQSKYFAEEV